MTERTRGQSRLEPAGRFIGLAEELRGRRGSLLPDRGAARTADMWAVRYAVQDQAARPASDYGAASAGGSVRAPPARGQGRGGGQPTVFASPGPPHPFRRAAPAPLAWRGT